MAREKFTTGNENDPDIAIQNADNFEYFSEELRWPEVAN